MIYKKIFKKITFVKLNINEIMINFIEAIILLNIIYNRSHQ